MWASSARTVNYNLPPEMGMVGLRDVFVVAPASSFHHNQLDNSMLSDPHGLNGSNAATALGVGVGVGVIPLLTAAPCLGGGVDDGEFLTNRSRGGGGGGGGIQFWQHQQQHQSSPQHMMNYMKKSTILDHNNSANLLQSGGGIQFGTSSAPNTSSSSTTTCQDCGNQAKKDCSHNRCRTCCKSRGFDCTTHVKSTWVPAARRRERQLMSATVTTTTSGSTSGAKKPRLITSQQTTTTSHTSTSNTTPPRSYDTTSSHQDGSFKEALPGQVRAPATFKCVRVTAVDDGEDEYAYQAVVKIGGHVFKGFLYDQGVETRDGFPNISELHLGGGGGSSGGGRNNNGASSPILDPSDVYAATGGALLGGGSGYGNPIN